MFKFIPEIKDHERYGLPINKDNSFISLNEPKEEILDKIDKFINIILPLFKKYGIEIEQDSEQGICSINLGDEMELLFYNNNSIEFEILEHGYLCGKLIKKDG